MSYSCTISFKQIAGNDVYSFLQEFKKVTTERFESIANSNASFSPISRSLSLGADRIKMTDELLGATENWARNTVFKYRFFYNSDLQLLGMYGVDECMKDMFNCTVHFQNSCDQDYDYNEWSGIKYFESVVEKWKNSEDEKVIENFKETIRSEWDAKENDIDYWKKSFVYREIWGNFENTLEDDSSVVYLSLFGSYEILSIKQFVALIRKRVNFLLKKEKTE